MTIYNIENLFQKKIDNNLSEPEQHEFENIFLNDENEFVIKHILYKQLENFENYPDDSEINFKKFANEFYFKLKSLKLEKEKSKNYFIEYKQRQTLIKIASIAAIFLLTVVLSSIFPIFKTRIITTNEPVANQFVIEAPLGAKSNIFLPDGSNVWLNAGSTLKYSSLFNGSNRKLELNGEAYFDVAKNESLPFEVITTEISIIALGTKFNVNAYQDESFIETTLVEGKVVINKNNVPKNTKGIVLLPNQKATFIKESNKIDLDTKKEINKSKPEKISPKNGELTIIKEINPELFTSWKDKRWQIEAEKLSSLAIKLERRFNVKIRFMDKCLSNYIFTGSLEDETLEQVLNAIKFTAPIEYSIENNIVTIKENKIQKEEFNKILVPN